MTGDELREHAKSLRAISAQQSLAHAELARKLAAKVSLADEVALKALAGVSDCMARRYRQWAMHLEEAAGEMDETPT